MFTRKIGNLVVAAAFLGLIAGCATGDTPPTTQEVAPTQAELEREQMAELDRLEKEDLAALKQDEGGAQEVRDKSFEASGLQTVYFEFDRYELTSSAKEALTANAEFIKGSPDAVVQIEGHCDERGTGDYNLALGEKRAMAAKMFLVSLGIEDSRLYTISYGEEKPDDPGHTEAAWSKNRRAIFKITNQ